MSFDFNSELDALMESITDTLCSSLNIKNNEETRSQIKEQLESLITGYEELDDKLIKEKLKNNDTDKNDWNKKLIPKSALL